MKPIFYLLIIIAFAGCSQNQKSADQNTKTSAVALSVRENLDQVKFPPPDQKRSQSIQSSEQKIIKEGEVTFETFDLTSTRNRIISELKKAGGYLDSESQRSSEYSSKTVELDVRIPADRFDVFLKNVSAKDDQIIDKNIRLTDVTTQYIDSKTRLESRKLLEKRYLQLLEKATKVSDVLEIENKLADIRSEIESQQGQLNYLLKQVQYSSLSITFFVKGATENEPGFAYRIRQSFAESLDVVSGIFFGVIHYWPLILLVFIAAALWRNYRRKKSIGMAKTKS